MFFALKSATAAHPGTTSPDRGLTTQQARNLPMDSTTVPPLPVPQRPSRPVHHRSIAVLAGAGIDAVKIPPRCPRANCFAERFVRTARTELTDRILICGERHLRSVLTRYGAHYYGRRPHRALQLRPPRPDHPAPRLDRQQIRRRSVLGGLISEYERAA
jgi:hypothetical protein